MTSTRKRTKTMIVIEIVIRTETCDAKETAIGTVTATETGTETGIAIDGTLACHSLIIIPSVIADNRTCFSPQVEAGTVVVAITGNLRTVSDEATCVSLALSL